MKKSLTVFICSTKNDLLEEREAVLEVIRRLQLHHGAMEYFGARPSRSIKTCLDEVRQSDILVVIVGHRYGNYVPNRRISFSEAEYKEGQKLKKACLVYLKDESTPILPVHFERDPDKIRALEAFKKRLQDHHTTAPFTSKEDLAVRVAADLNTMVQLLERDDEEEQEFSKGQIAPSYFSTIDELLNNDALIPAVEVGKIFLHRKQYDKSLRLLHYIREKADPSHRDYYNVLGNIAYNLNGKREFKEALKYLREVKKHSHGGKYFFAWHALAKAWAIYNLEGKTEEYWKTIEYAKARPEYKGDTARMIRLYPKIKDDLRIGKSTKKTGGRVARASTKKIVKKK